MATNKKSAIKQKEFSADVFEPMLILLSKEAHPKGKTLFKGCDVNEISCYELFNMGKSLDEFSVEQQLARDMIYSLNLRPRRNQTKFATIIKGFKPSLVSAVMLSDHFGYIFQFNEIEDIYEFERFNQVTKNLRAIDKMLFDDDHLSQCIYDFGELIVKNNYGSRHDASRMINSFLPSSDEFDSAIRHVYERMTERLAPR
jgi:hypothetical protein